MFHDNDLNFVFRQVILSEPQLTALRSPVLGNHGILSNEGGGKCCEDGDDDASLSETVVAGGSEVGAVAVGSESVVSFGGSLKGTPKIIKKGGEKEFWIPRPTRG